MNISRPRQTQIFSLGKFMSERNGTANLLAQVTAFRELKEDYNPEVAENLTARNLQRHGINATTTDVKAWDKINNAALQGHLDIPAEVVIAEGKAASAAGTTLGQAAQNVVNLDEQNSEQSGDDSDDDDLDDDSGGDDDDISDEDDERPSIDEMYGYDDPEDNQEAALDDVLKIQENS
jgi:hypothetical protein